MAYASWGYVADYLTFEEAAEICVDAAKRLQERFSSWEEYQANYLLGNDFDYCTTEHFEENHNYILERFESLKNLESKPFNLDFNTELKLEDMKESQVSAGMAKEERWKFCIPVALLAVWLGWLLIPKRMFKSRVKKADSKLKADNFGAN